MKIALFHNMKFGGAMRAAHEIAKGLAGCGHELHLFRYEFDQTRPDLYDIPKEMENPLDFSSIATLHSLPDPRPRHPTSQVSLGWRVNKVIKEVNLFRDLGEFERRARSDAERIDALECDVVLLHQCHFTNAPLLLEHLRTPSLWFCQEPARDLFETTDALLDTGKGIWERLYRRRRRHVELSAARAADVLLCNSAFSREFILRAYGIDAHVCRLGVNTEKFVPRDIPKKHQLICWGPLWPAKGLDFIIRSVSRIPAQQRPTVVFPWARGSAAYRSHLETLGEAAGVAVSFPKGLDDEALLSLIWESKVCAYAPHLELLGLVALEAMSAGLPVVGVREGGVRETVLDGETGFLCDRNEAEFASRLLKLLTDESLRRAMSLTAIDYVRDEWTWTQTVRSFEVFSARLV
jgi:glycosyltransferase involved in cell wall biosynthesis